MKKLTILIFSLCLTTTFCKAQVAFGEDEKNYVISGPMNAPVNCYTDARDYSSIILAKERLEFYSSRLKDNWFSSAMGGFSSFINAPNTSTDFSGRTNTAFLFSIGKFHTPYFGNRIAFQGFKLIGYDLYRHNYQNFHIDQLFNISSLFRSDFISPYKWNVLPYIGLGLIHNSTINISSFSFSYGINTTYAITKHIKVSVEIGGTTAFQNLDGVGKKEHFGDNLFIGMIGFQYNFGHEGFRQKENLHKVTIKNEELNSPDPSNWQKKNYSGLDALRRRLENVNMEDNAESTSIDGDVYGTPILFFFKLNSTKLVDDNQKVNIKELAGFIKQNDLYVKIMGSADSKTGTEKRNRQLSISRALYIAKLLRASGVEKERIFGFSQGGVNMYHPYTANRHTCIVLYKKK